MPAMVRKGSAVRVRCWALQFAPAESVARVRGVGSSGLARCSTEALATGMLEAIRNDGQRADPMLEHAIGLDEKL